MHFAKRLQNYKTPAVKCVVIAQDICTQTL